MTPGTCPGLSLKAREVARAMRTQLSSKTWHSRKVSARCHRELTEAEVRPGWRSFRVRVDRSIGENPRATPMH